MRSDLGPSHVKDLVPHESKAELRESIKDYFLFYYTIRTYKLLAKQTLDEVQFEDIVRMEAA